jgi:hypothetical protein
MDFAAGSIAGAKSFLTREGEANGGCAGTFLSYYMVMLLYFQFAST